MNSFYVIALVLSLARLGNTKEPLSSAELAECQPFSEWGTECHSCRCDENGRSTCTKSSDRNCVNAPDPQLCKPETTFTRGCHICFCHNTGTVTCTLDGCDMSQFTKAEPSTSSLIGHRTSEQDDINLKKNLIEKPSHNNLKRSVCKPNQIFDDDCNICKCSSDGLTLKCTKNECMDKEDTVDKGVDVFMESEGTDHIERHSVCRPRGTFYIGCNTCHCNLDGTDYSCTNKPCPLPDDVELFHELRVENRTVICVANRYFIKDCNTCWCNEDGTGYFCTRKVCVIDLEEDLNNQTDATLIRKIRTVSAAQSPVKNCLPDQNFRLDCNTCLCDSLGLQYSCTRIDCRHANAGGGSARKRREVSQHPMNHCEPGSVFNQAECNVCRCTSDGRHATCTLNRCTPGAKDMKKTGNVVEQSGASNLPATKNSDDKESNFRCNPGEQFKNNCNDCTCSADGKSVYCTLYFCNEDTEKAIQDFA